ncbi:helix-turn-helix transcriptional regulator [Gordonia sp. N1V]|uniref:helix-turn-helix domain-containing protein n=1 Tax=Gordonia sp. N1V TaxID=3034163 RepID=UPI0023E28C95|nr:helix-turn-helix transcriptional regulator [Gordonia sp. N1V]MDF3280852.1 helix-turn-helix transcriptional regulator [Gordonia sp. N1V]
MTRIGAQRLAKRVRTRTAAAGITQQQAADALHMSQSAFSRRYLGRVEFRASELETLAKLLGTTVSDLVGESGEKASA